MRYVVSGATSGTGDEVIRRLCSRLGPGKLACLVRPTSDITRLQSLPVTIHVGDVTEPESITPLLSPGVVYLDMTHPKYYHRSLEAVVSAGVERAFFVTTTGVYSSYNHCSEIYKINEERIRKSGVVYTILRPSMIYGSRRDKNMNRLIRFLARSPIFPLFGDGSSLMQPVFVEDLAAGIVSAVLDAPTEDREYNLAGPEAIAYRDIVDTILVVLGRRVRKLSVGTTFAARVTRFAQHFPGFPIREEQVLRLLEDKVFDIAHARVELGYSPRSFRDGITREIGDLRAAGVLS